MKLNLKDEPREWRKSAWLLAGGLALIMSVLRWRHMIVQQTWLTVLGILTLMVGLAAIKPRWFRGCHLLSMLVGFALSQFIGRCVLMLFFLLILTPLGWGLRLAGKDPLQLKRQPGQPTYWHTAKTPGSLDRPF